MRSQRVRTLVTVLVVAGLGLTSCGDDTVDPPEATTTPIATPSPSPTASTTPSPSPTVSPSPTATPSAEPTPSPSPLAGEPFDGPPVHGEPASLAVIGVAADDVLNVRAGPGVDAEIVATLAPLASEVPATGAARRLPRSIWLEVEADGTTGWANSSFFAYLGGTDDITSRLLAGLDERPSAGTLERLAVDVGGLVASEDPPSRIVITDGPSVGDLGEVTVDVIGLGDDALRGLRLVVFATVDADTFTLRTVEATELCARGGGSGGPCP